MNFRALRAAEALNQWPPFPVASCSRTLSVVAVEGDYNIGGWGWQTEKSRRLTRYASFRGSFVSRACAARVERPPAGTQNLEQPE